MADTLSARRTAVAALLAYTTALTLPADESPRGVRHLSDPCDGLAALELWLCRATFTIPKFSLDEGLIGLTVDELHCKQAKIGSLVTTPDPSAGGGKAPTFSFSISDAEVSCQSSHVHFDKPIPLSTTMTLEISGVSASSTLVLAVDQDGLPASASLENTNAHVQQLHLSILGLPSWVLQGVVDLFKSTITKQIVSVRAAGPARTSRAPVPRTSRAPVPRRPSRADQPPKFTPPT